MLALQSGDQNENDKKNREAHETKMSHHQPMDTFDINGFSMERALESLHKNVDSILDVSNVILASLGPKIGALALYKYHRAHRNTSLVYAPSNEFNRQYSTGYSGTIKGEL